MFIFGAASSTSFALAFLFQDDAGSNLFATKHVHVPVLKRTRGYMLAPLPQISIFFRSYPTILGMPDLNVGRLKFFTRSHP